MGMQINESTLTFIAEQGLDYLQGRAIELIIDGGAESIRLAVTCLERRLTDRAVPIARPLLPPPPVAPTDDEIPSVTVRKGAFRKGKRGGNMGSRVCDRCGKEKGITGYPSGSSTCRMCLGTATGRPQQHRTRQLKGDFRLAPKNGHQLPPHAYRLSVAEYKRFKRSEGMNALYESIRNLFKDLKSEDTVSIYPPKGDAPEERVPGWEILNMEAK